LEESTKPRIRINAKETSKGEWYFEATAETDGVEVSANLLIRAVKAAQENFKMAGKKLVSDTV